MKIKNISVYDICLIGMFTAFIAVFAQISVPLPNGVPMTLQTLAVMMTGVVLGYKRGTISVVVYILLGTAGMPIFASFGGGMGHLFSFSGGFIISFPILAFFSGIGAAKSEKNIIFLWLFLVFGVLINYFCGTVYFSFIAEKSLSASFLVCVPPFVFGDVIKVVTVGLFGRRIRGLLY